jgi:hypothetical protein
MCDFLTLVPYLGVNEQEADVAVVTPALFARLGERGSVPRLAVPSSLELYEGFREWSIDERLESYLEPVAFELALKQTVSGVPLLDENRVMELLEGLDEVSAEQPPQGRWWDFIRTESGEYALFPGDYEPNTKVLETLLELVGSAIQLRRLDTKWESDVFSLRQHGEDPEVLEEPCIHEIYGVDEGAPYVGRCQNSGCAEGCTPRVYVTHDDGIYRLVGCNC